MDLNINGSFFDENDAGVTMPDVPSGDYVLQQVSGRWFLDNTMPESVDALRMRGNLFYASGQYKEAAEVHEKALNLLPVGPSRQRQELNESLACSLSMLNSFKRAEKTLSDVACGAPPDVKLRCVLKLYDLYKRKQDPGRCLSILFVLIAAYEDSPKYWFELHCTVSLLKEGQLWRSCSCYFCESCFTQISNVAFSCASRLCHSLQRTSCDAIRRRIEKLTMSGGVSDVEKPVVLPGDDGQSSSCEIDVSATEFSYHEDELQHKTELQKNCLILDESEALQYVCRKWFNTFLCPGCIKRCFS